MSGPYDDIIHLPHHVSATRPQMSRANRAAQFSPFAALAGYESAIKETARLTNERIELDDNAIADLDRKLRLLAGAIAGHPEIAVTHFQMDGKKDGGAYITDSGPVKKIDDYKRVIVMASGERIAFEDVLEIECGLFDR